mmetsp:Transcript_6767/g.17331  ORF Transcript_6767/g.17331 Transcript_6767/m.17331 type:complete len:305 (-) Transcript_6767:728-1642(-)
MGHPDERMRPGPGPADHGHDGHEPMGPNEQLYDRGGGYGREMPRRQPHDGCDSRTHSRSGSRLLPRPQPQPRRQHQRLQQHDRQRQRHERQHNQRHQHEQRLQQQQQHVQRQRHQRLVQEESQLHVGRELLRSLCRRLPSGGAKQPHVGPHHGESLNLCLQVRQPDNVRRGCDVRIRRNEEGVHPPPGCAGQHDAGHHARRSLQEHDQVVCPVRHGRRHEQVHRGQGLRRAHDVGRHKVRGQHGSFHGRHHDSRSSRPAPPVRIVDGHGDGGDDSRDDRLHAERRRGHVQRGGDVRVGRDGGHG